MVATRPTTHLVVHALTTLHPLTTMDHLSMLAEAHAWWGRHQAKVEEMATIGETTPWEEVPTEEATSTEEAGAEEEESQASEAEDEEGPEEDTTTWMVYGASYGLGLPSVLISYLIPELNSISSLSVVVASDDEDLAVHSKAP